jgi:hypothetical protein
MVSCHMSRFYSMKLCLVLEGPDAIYNLDWTFFFELLSFLLDTYFCTVGRSKWKGKWREMRKRESSSIILN